MFGRQLILKIMLNCFKPIFRAALRPISCSYTRLCPVEVADSGQVVRRSEFRKFDCAEENRRFDGNDFSIANLVAVGAYNKLQYSVMYGNNDMEFVDNFVQSVSKPEKLVQ